MNNKCGTTKRITACGLCLAISLIAFSSLSIQAQLGGLIGKKKTEAGGSPIDKDSYAKSVDGALAKVSQARIAFLDSQTVLRDALGIKTEAGTKLSEARRAIEGASSNSGEKVKALKESVKVSEAANKELKEALDKSGELSAESKIKFAEGAARFVQGVILEKEQIENIQKLVQSGNDLVKTANPVEKLKVVGLVKPITELSSFVPGDLKEGLSTLGGIMQFAKKQKLDVPGADKATGKVGDLD